MTYKEWWVAVTICVVAVFGCIFWAGYQWGYDSYKLDHVPTIKYKCFEGIVYRSTSGYWEDTKQSCKTLEQIK
jgi:hypothetical protein